MCISSELLDDIPVGDPRWLNEHGGLGSSSSMQILHQLEDKKQALNLFLQFLQQIGKLNLYKTYSILSYNKITKSYE